MDAKRSRDATANDPDELKVMTLVTAFDNLPLEKKRTIIPRFLESARVVYGLFVEPVTDKFKIWITRGNIKQFTEEDVEKLWKFWTLIKKYSNSSFASVWDEEGIFFFICQESDGYRRVFTSVPDAHHHKNSKDHLSKDDYFDWILENTIPEQVKVDHDYVGHCYTFPRMYCDEKCKCPIDSDAFASCHEWIVDDRAMPSN